MQNIKGLTIFIKLHKNQNASLNDQVTCTPITHVHIVKGGGFPKRILDRQNNHKTDIRADRMYQLE